MELLELRNCAQKLVVAGTRGLVLSGNVWFIPDEPCNGMKTKLGSHGSVYGFEVGCHIGGNKECADGMSAREQVAVATGRFRLLW